MRLGYRLYGPISYHNNKGYRIAAAYSKLTCSARGEFLVATPWYFRIWSHSQKEQTEWGLNYERSAGAGCVMGVPEALWCVRICKPRWSRTLSAIWTHEPLFLLTRGSEASWDSGVMCSWQWKHISNWLIIGLDLAQNDFQVLCLLTGNKEQTLYEMLQGIEDTFLVCWWWKSFQKNSLKEWWFKGFWSKPSPRAIVFSLVLLILRHSAYFP